MNRYKAYTARVIPQITKGERDADGKQGEDKVKYIKPTNPRASAREAGFNSDDMIQLQLFEKGEGGKFDVDLKPFTYNVFRNTQPTLFDLLEGAIEAEEYDVVSKMSHVAVLRDKIFGLVVREECAPYHPTITGEDGIDKPLTANQRNRRTGSYDPTPVVMNYVQFFMPKSMCHEDEEAFQKEKKIMAAGLIDDALEFPVKIKVSTPEHTSAGEKQLETTPDVQTKQSA